MAGGSVSNEQQMEIGEEMNIFEKNDVLSAVPGALGKKPSLRFHGPKR